MSDSEALTKKIAELEDRIADLCKLMESSQDVFYRTDGNGILTFITPSIERYAGYRPDQLVGKLASSVYAVPEERDQLVAELARSGSVEDYELRLVDVDGKTHFVSLNARALIHEGKFAGVEGLMRDRTRRRTLELAVSESEQRFRMLAENSPVGIFLSDKDGNCVLVNRKWCELAGMSVADAAGHGWINALHPADRKLSTEWQESTRQGKAFETQCRFQTPEGRVSIVQKSATPLVDKNGAFAGYVGTVTDITRTQKAEQAVRNLAAVVESAEDGIIVVTLEGIILSWNKGAERLYGYASEETLGRHVDSLHLAEHHWETLILHVRRLLSGQRLESLLGNRVRKDGTAIQVSFTLSLVRDAEGVPIGVTGIARDVTARRAEQDALQRSEETFRTIFTRGPIGIAIVNLNLRFTRVNPSLTQTLGRAEQDLIGRHIDDITHPEDRQDTFHLADSLFRGQIPYFEFEKRFLTAAGGVIWAHLTMAAIPDSNGKPLLGLAMIEDITGRKELERDREQIISELQGALANVKTLTGLLPMCAWCKRIRDDHGSWDSIEAYIRERSDADFTHGICPDCKDRVRLDLGLTSEDVIPL